MKIFTLSLAIFFGSQLLAADESPKKELLKDIQRETRRCTVQVVATKNETRNENVVGYRSVCKTLKVLSPSEAQVFIDNEWLTATISESAESDGGDLDDLTIVNSRGQIVAQKTNIASYDSVLVAMSGDTNFRRVYTSNF